MLQGKVDRTGQVTVTWNIADGSERLLSPDGTQQPMPCEACGKVSWRPLNVVALVCEDCFEKESAICPRCGRTVPCEDGFFAKHREDPPSSAICHNSGTAI